MPSIMERDRQWLAAHSEQLAWLNSLGAGTVSSSPVLRYLRDWLENHLSLTDTQTEVLYGLHRDVRDHGSWNRANSMSTSAVEGTHGYDPAGPGDMSNLRNGTYYLRGAEDEGDVQYYQIYTAMRGDLAGQRLLKFSNGGRPFAFATVLRDGRVHVWRRFQDSANEGWIVEGLQLVRDLLSYPTPTTGSNMDLLFDFGSSELGGARLIQGCRRCNLNLVGMSSSIHSNCLDDMLPPLQVVPAAEQLEPWEQELLNSTPQIDVPGYEVDADEVEDEEVPQPRVVGNPQLECEYCDEVFELQTYLWRHRRTSHSEEYPHHCAYGRCYGSFSNINERNVHQRTHRTGSRTRDLLGTRENITPTQAAPTPVVRARMSEIDPTWLQ